MDNGGADITSQYVSSAAQGGLAALSLFVVILVSCFQKLGMALQEAREVSSRKELLLWCLGAVLFAHLITLFSITYFDQMHVAWWGLVASIASVSSRITGQTATDTFLGNIDELVPVGAKWAGSP
jgi:hypothetical protein